MSPSSATKPRAQLQPFRRGWAARARTPAGRASFQQPKLTMPNTENRGTTTPATTTSARLGGSERIGRCAGRRFACTSVENRMQPHRFEVGSGPPMTLKRQPRPCRRLSWLEPAYILDRLCPSCRLPTRGLQLAAPKATRWPSTIAHGMGSSTAWRNGACPAGGETVGLRSCPRTFGLHVCPLARVPNLGAASGVRRTWHKRESDRGQEVGVAARRPICAGNSMLNWRGRPVGPSSGSSSY